MTNEGAIAEAYRLVAFINTLHPPVGDDALADGTIPESLADWLGIRTAGAGERLDPDALIDLRTLREGLRELAAANNGQQPDRQTVVRAATVLRSAPMVVDLGDHRRAPRVIAPAAADPAGHGIAAVAGAYLAIWATDDWLRLKACAAPDCRWAYLDTSRNRSRRWCNMAHCGNRAKNRTWRERQRRAAEDR